MRANPIRDECGGASAEYIGIVALVLGGAGAFAYGYSQWVAEAFGGSVDPIGPAGLTQVLSSWGGAGPPSNTVVGVTAGVGVTALLVRMLVYGGSRRRGSTGARWGTALVSAVVVAALLVGLRFAMDALNGAQEGLPTTSSVMAVLVAILGVSAGWLAGWAVRPRSRLEATLAGSAAGLVVATFGQVVAAAQGSAFDGRQMLTTGGIVLLAAVGGLAGSVFVRSEVFAGLEEESR